MKLRKRCKWIAPAIGFVALLAMVTAGSAQTGRKGSGKILAVDILNGIVTQREVAIERGTTIIWRNWTDKSVNVYFTTGKRMARVCEKSAGFARGTFGYEASNIPPGGEARLCFLDSGIYHYVVDVEGGLGGEGAPPPAGMIAVVKDLKYQPVATSWVDLNWDVVPGLVDAPFSVRGWPAASISRTRVAKKK